ncbi:hypothetical protein RKD48_004132 [Streptomyces ambofaciens]
MSFARSALRFSSACQGRLRLGFLGGEPGLRPQVLADRPVHGEVRAGDRPLTAHQLVGIVGEEHPRGERESAAVAVLGTGDAAQALLHGVDRPPLPVEPPLVLQGLRPLCLGRSPPVLVPAGRLRRVLVQARHLRSQTGAGSAFPVRAVGGAGRQHGERAQQHRNERRASAG